MALQKAMKNPEKYLLDIIARHQPKRLKGQSARIIPVAYTPLTLPTNREVYVSVVARDLKKTIRRIDR